jgi:hypothetical protein
MTSGLNFITLRPRLNVLKDYHNVIKFIYNPGHYYERIMTTSLNLIPDYKYKPGIIKLLKNLKVLLKVCIKVGLNKTTGWLYWKTLLTVLFKNPRGFEAAVNLAAMYIHFNKQSQFIIDLTNNEIKSIESSEKENYNQLMFQEASNYVKG